MRRLYVASFYANLQATATRLLTSKGQSVTFTRSVETAFNSGTGVKTTSDFTFSSNGAAFDYKASEIDGTVIKAGDIRLMLEKGTNEPAIGDSAKIDAVNYRVMDVTKSSPAGIVTHYTCRLRK